MTKYVMVPQSAMDWLMGEGDDFEPSEEQIKRSFGPGRYWWRSEFQKRIAAAPPSLPADIEQLVGRLRMRQRERQEIVRDTGTTTIPASIDWEICHEAAAALESLAREREELKREVASANAEAIANNAKFQGAVGACAHFASEARRAQEAASVSPAAAAPDSVGLEVYEAAVKGRQQFRAAYRKAREALIAADAAINPPDRGGISMAEWNKRLKTATATIREVLTPSTGGSGADNSEPSLSTTEALSECPQCGSRATMNGVLLHVCDCPYASGEARSQGGAK